MVFFFFFKQKTAYEMQRGLVGSEMCIRDRYQRRVHGIYVEKYLELLEQGKIEEAIECLRKQITSRSEDRARLKELATFLLCPTKEELYKKAGWPGNNPEAKKVLLDEIFKLIDPQRITDSHRLEKILGQALKYQLSQCKFHNMAETSFSIMKDHSCEHSLVPSICVKTLTVHADEVWMIQFSPNGKQFATVSKDNVVIIWDIKKNNEKIDIRVSWRQKAHERPIHAFAWANSSQYFATASADYTVKVWNNETGKCQYIYDRHQDEVHSVLFCCDDTKVISAGIDKLIFITTLDGSSGESIQSVMVSELHVDDKRKRLIVVEAGGRLVICYSLDLKGEIFRIQENDSILSSSLSLDGTKLLLNVSLEFPSLHSWDLESQKLISCFSGHTQKRFRVRGIFGGYAESFVACGSEDAQIYVWNRATGKLVNTISGHTATVNAIAWSPVDFNCMISVSDDYTIRIWDVTQYPVEFTDSGLYSPYRRMSVEDLLCSEDVDMISSD
eukprot:TRINITY_DN30487_c0_g1_i2.p1 TRINITY_DN30487_c0_g1~~TRINITY_DN30487_c0_g1_i2.p1  ORF type:complete len:500 (-),score=74.70 TRINITY_DN30487_c0_g1_i2:45-1544(-)